MNMNTIPELSEIKRLAGHGDYKVIPVSCEIMSDFITPIEALRILKNASEHVYMLESARADDKWGRYTFLGFDPKLLITCKDGELSIGDKVIKTQDPGSEIRQVMKGYTSPRIEKLPPFTGGLVGYFSFEYLGYSEPTIRCDLSDEDKFMDLDLMLFDKVIAFDNMRQKIILIVNIKVDDIEKNYDEALVKLKGLAKLLKEGDKEHDPGGRLLGEVTPLFDKERFCEMVERGKEYIREGDIFQIVLSNRLSAPFEGSLLNTYRFLRTINPSPYMF